MNEEETKALDEQIRLAMESGDFSETRQFTLSQYEAYCERTGQPFDMYWIMFFAPDDTTEK